MLQHWQYMVAGAGAGAATRATCQPFDVLKIRLQLQVESHSGAKYPSAFHAARTIIAEEGVAALWSGHVPAQWLSITYGLVFFSTYESLNALCRTSRPEIVDSHKSLTNFACGAIAGGCATLISFPFDTIRTRIVAEDKKHRVYHGIRHTAQHMWINEGRLSLFKGIFPTAAQVAPQSGAQFMFYKLFTEFSIFSNTTEQIGILNSLSAGSISGMLSKLIVYPFDLAKKRLQLQGFQNHRERFGRQFYCRGFLDCILKTIKFEGFLGLYKGIYPSLLKAAIVNSLHFSFYEQFCNIFKEVKLSKDK